jgi:hypothetical protein
MHQVDRTHPYVQPRFRTATRTLVLLLGVLGLALAGLTPAAAAPQPSRAAATPAATQTTVAVALLTGDWVRLGTAPDGRQTATMLPRDRHGAAGSFRTERRNGDLYVFPTLVAPYLGRVLDPALFNVSQLARAGLTTASSRLPLRLTYRAGATHHAVPGITVTRTQGDTVDGYLTPASAAAFGPALAAQVRADAAAHWPIGGIFAGLTGVRYAGPAAAPPVQPHFPMVTLRILVTGADGQPAPFGSLLVVNTDDVRKFNGFPFIVNGEARISLPTGHYSFFVDTFDLVGDNFVDRIVNISDYQLTRAQTLTVDMRTATTQLAVHTPRPAAADAADLDWQRTDVNGLSFSLSFGFGAGFDVRVAPGQAARVGRLNFATGFHLSAPASEPVPYVYDLRFDSTGNAIPASLAYDVAPGDLATLNTRYHADGRREAVSARLSFLPWQSFIFGTLLPVTAPGARTEFVNSPPDGSWLQDYLGFLLIDFSDIENPIVIFAAELVDTFRQFPPGLERTVDFARPALGPGLDFDTGLAPFPYLCPACRQGNSIGVFLTPVTDTVPGHFGLLDFPQVTPFGPVVSTTRFRLFQNGTLLDDETDVRGTTVSVPAAGASYRVLYDQTRTAPWYTQGTRSQSEWTFTSAQPAGRTAPANWDCAPLPDGTLPPGDCAVLPLLTVNYAAPVDLSGRIPAGTNHLGVTVAPTQGAPAAAVTAATVEVSFDDGASWATAPVTGNGPGQFDAVFTAPATGFVSTRVHATDAAGNTVTQTVIRAYTVGAAA